MERSRKIKIMSITALVLAITALTLGFASFSKIMKISSSASSIILEENVLNLTLSGFVEKENYDSLLSGKSVDFSKLSKEKAFSFEVINSSIDNNYYATIDNDKLTINIDNLVMSKPGQQYAFAFLLENKSDHSAYLSLSKETLENAVIDQYGVYLPVTCIPEEDTTLSLVNDACSKILTALAVYTEEFSNIDFELGYYKLLPNKHVYLAFAIDYHDDAPSVDGEFSINVDQIKLDFSTVPPVTN